MFHRTICIKFSPAAATQTEIAGLLSAFQALGGQLAGLSDVSIEFLRGEYDAGVDLAFATEEARRDCGMDERYACAMARAQALCAHIECRETDDAHGRFVSSALPMKWHKFLIHFWLLLGALIFLIRGFGNLLDCFEGADALIHAEGPPAFAVTLFAGVCLLAIAALQLATRVALARFSRKGPKMAVAVCVSMAVLDGFILAAQQMHAVELDAGIAGVVKMGFVVSALLAACNHIYYRRRAAMFVH